MSNHCIDRIPVIDLFAGPGGLAEGFSACLAENENVFRIGLSVEKDSSAHCTLELRSFFRQFSKENIPPEYYAYLRKEISRSDLFASYPSEAEAARDEAWLAELGSTGMSEEKVDKRIKAALDGAEKWVLIGGPPCQAYSTAGRSRNKGKEGYIPEEDKRHFLYREYLRIIARHWPPVFVMENVKGLLSAKINGSNIFNHILEDLHDPLTALANCDCSRAAGYKYKIHSFVKPTSFPFEGNKVDFTPADYLIMSEDYGIPQARHRVILLGIREDMDDIRPENLSKRDNRVSTEAVLKGLPRVRSGLSREEDTFANWEDRVSEIIDDGLFDAIYDEHERDVWNCIGKALTALKKSKIYGRGEEFIPYTAGCGHRQDWYLDSELQGVCNHVARTHMTSDFHRYLFAACFAEAHGKSPTLPDFPKELWPAHKSAHPDTRRSGNFADRFRVQVACKPSTTIMSHIAKDGNFSSITMPPSVAA